MRRRFWMAACLMSLGMRLPAAEREVTFSRDVAPILYQHCVSCHHPNDIAPMSLLTYKEARPWAAAIKEAVLLRKMPPWKADPHYGKWSNDPSLSAAEIETVRAWADGGKLEGDPKEMPKAPVFVDGWKIGRPDVVVSIPEHKLEAKGPDEYSYIVVPTNFTEDRWVVAAELRPGNRKIVHHAHVFVVEEDQPAKAGGAKDPAAEYGRWLRIRQGTLSFIRPDAPVIDDGCAIDDNGAFPGSKQSDLGSLISSYLPGREPDVYPAGTARLIRAGAKLNFQIHYSRATGKTETDATSVGLIFAKEPPKQIARRIDLSNHMFLIPAGEPNQEVTECHTFRKDMYITSLTPHMHLRGKAMRMEVTYPDGRKETLLNVPHYDFNWQITYRAAKPIFIPKGTRLKIIAHFDNSPNNPMNPDPTRVVRWGAASETEMMDGWVEYVDTAPEPLLTSAAQ
ncbi:MAG TPA: thiol-disulfide isomerase [Bryobacteraceae bacterium]|nr:thiol-disulfide isomerase [Bryobacteraceae bacterium]